MAIEDTRKVSSTTVESYANALLDAGWKLLMVAPVTLEGPEGPYQAPAYTLGWQGEGDAPLNDYEAWRDEQGESIY
jgi:hypothetical protein